MWRFFFIIFALLLAGCEREPAVITPPKDAAAVIEPFLNEMAAGQRARAAALVSPAAQDELTSQFTADHKKLAAAPKLTPRFLAETNESFEFEGEEISPDGHEVTLVYAAQKGGKWTSATVRVYRYRDEPYKVEYWRVTNKAPTAVMNSGDEAVAKEMRHVYFWMAAGLVVLGIAGLALLFWLVKRRPQVISPDVPAEVRRNAATVRDE